MAHETAALVKPVSIMLDKERHLKITLGGMKKFQEKTGKNLLKGFNIADMDAGDLAAFVWSCLIWEDPELTLEKCEFMLDFARLTEISNKLAEALNISLPEQKGDAGANPQ